MATPVNGPLPVGTVTFLLTDVEGSTTGWESESTPAFFCWRKANSLGTSAFSPSASSG
jgi:hypothetical protein